MSVPHIQYVPNLHEINGFLMSHTNHPVEHAQYLKGMLPGDDAGGEMDVLEDVGRVVRDGHGHRCTEPRAAGKRRRLERFRQRHGRVFVGMSLGWLRGIPFACASLS
jgi:hypothetical protein